jgi:hypothetical protein
MKFIGLGAVSLSHAGSRRPHNAGVTERTDLGAASRAFVAAAFDVLAREHVIPPPIYHPFVAVGRDYFGGSIMGLAGFKAQEAHFNEAYSERFAEPLTRAHPEFATTYISASLKRA